MNFQYEPELVRYKVHKTKVLKPNCVIQIRLHPAGDRSDVISQPICYHRFVQIDLCLVLYVWCLMTNPLCLALVLIISYVHCFTTEELDHIEQPSNRFNI